MHPMATKFQFSDYSDERWLSILSNPDGDNCEIPSLPPEEIQLMITGASGFQTMQQAFAFYNIIRKTGEEMNKSLSSMDAILDFGCGWGRITRCFLREVMRENIYGCDCLPSMIQICNQTLPGCEFYENKPMPPLQYKSGMFDIIYAYSVFSHISEHSQKAWLKEFHRVLKPNGLLILTTRKRDFIPLMPLMPRSSIMNVEQALQDYDEGKYVHIPQTDDGPLNGTYGETAIPEQYIRSKWKRWFNIMCFLEKVAHIDQNIIVCQRKWRLF